MVINHDRKSFGSLLKKFQNLLRRLAPLKFLIRFQAFRDPPRGELLHVQIFLNDRSNPLTEMTSCSAIDLAEIRRSSKISSWIWSIISGVVTVLGASHVEKSPRLNWATQFLTVAYDSACSLNVSIRMAWISFGALPCRGEKNLTTAHVSMLLKSCTSPDMLLFNLCNKKSFAISNDTIDTGK